MERLSSKILALEFNGEEEEEEIRPWSDLQALVLERIRELLDSDLYDLRLRSVCSNWRASLTAYPRNRYPNFPIDLPQTPYSKGLNPSVQLEYSTFYRISPVDDPSDGWLMHSLDSKPNTFTLLGLLSNVRYKCHPEVVRNSIDLLQFRVSEVCKSYRIETTNAYRIRKVLFLPKFVENVAFTVLLAVYTIEGRTHHGPKLYYFNDGDSAWTAIKAPSYKFHDMILFNGICYVITHKGGLFSLDSEFCLKKVFPKFNHPPPARPLGERIDHFFATFESDLFLISMFSASGLMPKLNIYKWMSKPTGWYQITSLDDAVLFSDGITGLSAKDFKGCKGNCVYFSTHMYNKTYTDIGGITRVRCFDCDVYDLGKGKCLAFSQRGLRKRMFWPPPVWMDGCALICNPICRDEACFYYLPC